MTPQKLHILQHSLGLNQYGQGTGYRNRFVTGPESSDFKICVELCEAGLMKDAGPQSMTEGMHCFYVTPEGVEAIKEHSPKPPKLTRDQKRYQKFLGADSGMKFSDWIKTRRHKEMA